ncbi:MAG: glutamate--tRNA ligase [Eggerthellaceae bacterium]|nr:glutamate--tRNA ligase [Eggerthellaceae bacterium]
MVSNKSAGEQVRVRFAPSPTGRLHIGGARTAIYNWAFARATGGVFVLRIEDTDPDRSTEENTQIILRALRWMGLDWDEGPEVGGPFGPYIQTKRTHIYAEALEKLKAKNAVYPCFCSKEELEQKRAAAEEAGKAYIGYDKTCRDLDPAVAQTRIDAGEPHVWRLRVPEGHEPIEFDDAVYGHMSFPADVMDDMILVRSDGSPTYNFAVVCDDTDMRITHVIRGDDHLSNTPRQILIYEALGYPIPTFAHLSMILGPDGKKLSKRHGATSVEEYRDEGYLSDTMVNFLALLGWSLDGETTIIPRDVLCEKFGLNRITKKDAIFDETKLTWMNGVYIREMTPAAFVEAARPWLCKAAGCDDDGFFEGHRVWFEKLYPLLAERLVRLDEIPDKIAFLFWGNNIILDADSVDKTLKKEGCRAKEALLACRDVLADTSISWNFEALQDACKALCEPMELKPKLLFQPLRVAITGNMVSIPLFESIELMSRENVLARIDYTIDHVFEQ